MVHILQVVEAGPSIGSGHLKRQQILEQTLRHRGHEVTIVQYEGTAGASLGSAGCLDNFDLVIVDGVQGVSSVLRTASHARVLSCAFDWFGEPSPDISICVFPHAAHDGRLASLEGPEFMILDHDRISERFKDEAPRHFDYAVCLGGADVQRQSHRIASALGSEGANVACVYGPYAAAPTFPTTYRVLSNVASCIDVMADSSVAITNGGTTLFEALALGCPVVSVPQTKQELVVARHLGAPTLMATDLNDKTLKSIRQEILLRLAEGVSTKAVPVDSMGATRVANSLEEILEHCELV